MHELLVPILAFVAATSLGGAVLTARAAKRKPLRARLSEMETRVGNPETLATQGGWLQALERLVTMVSLGKPSPRLQEELAKAGYHAASAAKLYLGSKMFLFVIGLAVLTIVLLPLQAPLPLSVAVIVGGATALSFLPNAILRMRRNERCQNIRRHLPDALDLLEICVSAGMGLDLAWNWVADEVRGVSTTLADEMALTNLELHLGAPRAEAMRRMADRTGTEEVSSLVAVIVQSERFGTSISEALRTFAASMRERRSLRAAEAAEKTAVKMLFPLVLFIFPTIFVVTLGPALVVLAKVVLSR